MTITDRLTRTTTARFVWGGLTVLFVIVLAMSRSTANESVNEQIEQAQARAGGYARTTVADAAIVDRQSDTITFDKKGFAIALQGDVFTDPTVARLRVWGADGLLLASTDPSEPVGELVAKDDPSIRAALDGKVDWHVVQEPFTFSTVGVPKVSTGLLQVFTPFRVKDQVQPVGAVQVDFLYDSLTSAGDTASTRSTVFLVLAALCAAMFALSLLRRPVPAKEHVVTLSPETAVAAAAATPAAAPVDESVQQRNSELEEELQIAREQLQQASEAFAFLEAKVKDGAGKASPADVEAAMARITELEAALKQAEDDVAEARTTGVTTQEELDRVRREADERVAEAEHLKDPEIEELRSKLDEAERRAREAEDDLQRARDDVQVARQEADVAKADAARAEAEAVAAGTDAPTERADGVAVTNGRAEAPAEDAKPGDLIAELEAKVAEAEARAREAEEETLRLTPEASELRERLKQAAARKKPGGPR